MSLSFSSGVRKVRIRIDELDDRRYINELPRSSPYEHLYIVFQRPRTHNIWHDISVARVDLFKFVAQVPFKFSRSVISNLVFRGDSR